MRIWSTKRARPKTTATPVMDRSIAALLARCAVTAALVLCGLAAGCQSQEKRYAYPRDDDDVSVCAPGTAVDVDDDDVYVDAPFVNVRVRH